jgi:O-antigen/teichoic acid export membrane protein
MPSTTARIAKNTLMLYFRQVLIMLVSLYTVRVVLETLGVEDYGIYHVVAGIVTMFGFISNSMASASQRYFSYELGRGDYDQLKKIFSLTLLIYIFIAVLILLLAETIGLWFTNNKLVIPVERKVAALWVYQFSIISFLFTIMTSPYMAMIIAHENMNIYAYVSIIEVLLKLGMVFVLRFISWDKLILYGILMLAVVIINTAIYRTICIRKYKECTFSFYWNKILFKEIVSYSGWNMFGASTNILKIQGVNILLNQFFSPIVVAARSIATTVDNAAMSFSNNFNTAIRPQIIKSYAVGEKERMLLLMFRGSKGSYLLMYLFALPLVLEMPIVLDLWLKNLPEHAVLFTRLILFDALINSISFPLMATAQATGKIKLYQSVVGGILLLNVPVSWIILLLGAPPYSVLIIAIGLTIIAGTTRLLILKRLIDYSIKQFLKVVMVPIFFISLTSAILPIVSCYILVQNIARLFIVIVLSIISTGFFSYLIGFNTNERKMIKNSVNKYLDIFINLFRKNI